MNKVRLIALISISLVFFSCPKDDNEKTVYTVAFDADGGIPVPEIQRIEEGGIVIAPTVNPSKDGYIFLFWRLSGNSIAYKFATPVNSNITLQAKWEEEAKVEYWQVSWELNGGAWSADDNHATHVVKGGTLAEPAAPVKSGYIFDGWYKETALINKINFPYYTSSVTGNITLYAKWTSGSAGDITLNKISLDLHTTDREQLTTTSTDVSWSTSNKQVAIVNNNGMVAATGEGTAIITVSVGNKSATCNVIVKPSIIVGGYENSYSSYNHLLWKNGEKLDITEHQAPNILHSVLIYEGNIYIAGTSAGADGYRRASVSKIETAVPVNALGMRVTSTIMETKGTGSLGENMFISNGDVYLAGYDRGYNKEWNQTYYRASVWKNGKIQLLTDNVSGEDYAYSVFVAGNDVYVAGRLNQKPALWKNGILQELKLPVESINEGEARAVSVLGSDVFVAGYTKYYNPIVPTVPTSKPTLWKNGIPTNLDEKGGLYSMLIYGNDVYAAGSGSNTLYWKNGIPQEKNTTSLINSIYVYNEDVYIASRDGLWINGKKQSYAEKCESVFVK